MNKQKIIVAFPSQTVSALFCDFLTKKGFEIFTADNGPDLLEMAIKKKPSFIITSINLPEIDGYNISRIIKNTREFKNTSVILCSVENDSVRRYWAEISQCDSFYHINESDISSLENLIQMLNLKKSESKEEEQETEKELNKNDVLTLSVRAYDKEFFDLNVIKSAFKHTSGFDFETLFKELSKNVISVVNYDALGVILSTSPIVEFYSFSPKIKKSEQKDFIRICHTDFEEKSLSMKRFEWKKSVQFSRTNESNTSNANFESIKSSESYPAEPQKNLPFTMTVGSGRVDAFHSRTTERLSYIMEIYSQVFQQAINYNKLADAEDKIEKAFGRFVPQSVINDIISGSTANASNAGEKRNVAVMITDIRSFTSISEINEPEKVVEFLNGFFTIMGSIIKKHGGIIDKFMGDAIMALFGAPESYEDNAARAARAAIEMHQALKTINVDLNLPAGYTFSIGTGIHYGSVIVGSLGSAEKKEYTVIGDNVNISSRLEGLTKLYGSPIIISEAVKNDLKDEIPARHLDNVKVKGKSVAIPIYALYPDGLNQVPEFYENYKKALNQYTIGNFTMAIDYLEKAKALNPDDKASKVLMDRCNEYKQNRPENWTGAVMLTTK